MKTRTLLLVALIGAVLAVLIFNVSGLAASAQLDANSTKYKVVSRGEYASLSWSSNNRYGSVYVARTKVGAGAETWLSYDISECTEWECYTVEAGSGYIPNDDFVRGVGLNTDTSAIPDFILWAGSGGVIAVEWTPLKGVSYRYHGTIQQRFSDYRYMSNGTWEYTMAAAQGSVVGVPVEGSIWAEAGKNHNVTLEMSRER